MELNLFSVRDKFPPELVQLLSLRIDSRSMINIHWQSQCNMYGEVLSMTLVKSGTSIIYCYMKCKILIVYEMVYIIYVF